MLRKFIASILILFIFNFLFKGIRYFVYDRADGKVIRHESVLMHYTIKDQGRIEKHQKWMQVPVIAFSAGNEEITFNMAELELVEFLDDGDEVKVLYDISKKEYRVATFINYWLTFYDIAIGLVLALVGPLAFAILKAIKKWLASIK